MNQEKITPEEYLHIAIIQSLQSDIDLYLGHSENMKEIMYKKMGIRPFGKDKEEVLQS